ncbi:TIGR02265 family protein [Melittangium boletus]|uniref:TIGR02265 family protein n=1 Tax=Melittangium boletus TaxID=83453 RepID=UPI003DA346FE
MNVSIEERTVLAEQELAQHLAWLSPQDTLRGMFFRSVQEALLALRGEAALEVCLEACGGVRDFVDFFAYPARDFVRMLGRAATLMAEGDCSSEDMMRMLGYLGTAVFLKSPVGRAMDVLSSGTPRRVLENLPMAYQVLTPMAGPLTVTWLSPTRARVTFTRSLLPSAYLEGLLEALLKKAGARGVRVACQRLGPLSSEHDLTWSVS